LAAWFVTPCRDKRCLGTVFVAAHDRGARDAPLTIQPFTISPARHACFDFRLYWLADKNHQVRSGSNLLPDINGGLPLA
jgi:hypothetical protein